MQAGEYVPFVHLDESFDSLDGVIESVPREKEQEEEEKGKERVAELEDRMRNFRQDQGRDLKGFKLLLMTLKQGTEEDRKARALLVLKNKTLTEQIGRLEKQVEVALKEKKEVEAVVAELRRRLAGAPPALAGTTTSSTTTNEWKGKEEVAQEMRRVQDELKRFKHNLHEMLAFANARSEHNTSFG